MTKSDETRRTGSDAGIAAGVAASRTVLVVDDHALILDGMSVLLPALEPGIRLLTASDLESAAALIDAGAQVDLTLLDLGLPGHTTTSALDEFRMRYPSIPVVVLSGQVDDRSLIIGALDRGAMGFIPKNIERRELMAALRRVVDGEIYVPAHPIAASPPASRGERDASMADVDLERAASIARKAIDAMTPRQRDVLRLLLKGHTNKLIARALGLSDNTVKIHVSAVLHAIGVSNRTQAVFVASRAGLRL